MAEPNLGHEPLEARPALGRGAGAAEIVVDDADARPRPAQSTGAFGETVLQRRGLAMLLELLQRGLSNVDDGQPVKMARLDLAPQHRAGRAHSRRPHGPSPLRGSSTAGAAVPSGRSGRPVCADPLPVSRARTEPPGPCRGLPRHVALQRASANSASALAKTCNATSFAEVRRTEVVPLQQEAGGRAVQLAVSSRRSGAAVQLAIGDPARGVGMASPATPSGAAAEHGMVSESAGILALRPVKSSHDTGAG